MISPQAQSLYQILLATNGSLSARELGIKLHIFPNTIYRLVDELDQVGLIIKDDQYPLKFTAKSADEGLSLFLLSQTGWFSKQFSNKKQPKKETLNSQDLQFNFVQSRDELMRLSVGEINKAKSSFDVLRSGHEIPADVMLAMAQAKKRNVITRMLIQDYGKHNESQVIYWKQNGALVRQTPNVNVRLMIYDKRIVYFMSYKNQDSQKDSGMRIDYPPFTVILSQLFDTWWKKAKKI